MKNDIQAALEKAHIALVAYLDDHLPQIFGDDWWKKAVIWKLSVSQEKWVKEKSISEIGQLDLAALLRVLDKNWYEMSEGVNLSRDGRSLVNEVRNIRNRLAHHSLEEYKSQDAYRDADTIYRFVTLLGADAEHRDACESILRKALSALTGTSNSTGEDGRAGSSPVDKVGAGTLDPFGQEHDEDRNVNPPGLQAVPADTSSDKGRKFSEAQVAIKATYVGIDFGTSTTVVSFANSDVSGNSGFYAEPMPIRQSAASGAEVEDHLVPSCLAWYDGELLVGQAARELAPSLRQNRSVWSSFKMGLGIDLGVQYPNSELSGEEGRISILSPQDAAKHFFIYLREEIEHFVQKNGMPARIYYSVSVPAGFEANQRQDLIDSLEEAGISVEEASLIDEPNAAFLSYLMSMQSGTANSNFLESILQKPKKILVFDFGAGTCDISVLEVGIMDEKISSRNRSISRFMALGGDNIDFEIAKRILLPQLCDDQNVDDCFTVNELEQTVLPHLKSEAERLKISCSKYARDKGLGTVDRIKTSDDIRFQGKPIPPIKLRGQEWSIHEPSISLHEFAEVMSTFVQIPDSGQNTGVSVLQPVKNAMEKAGLENDQLNMVLFIGGSSENPLVMSCIEDYFGRFVECVVPQDLRSHVSQGAAINSLFLNGLGWELIQPITSEPLIVATRDEGSEVILEAGTVVPSPEISVSHFFIDSDKQSKVELPICVGSVDRVLAVLSLSPPEGITSFTQGDEVSVSCSITRDKILKVRAKVRGVKVVTDILNPMSNIELTHASKKLMEARQELNQSILDGKGKPDVMALITYGHAASDDGRCREAAEVFEAVERLDKGRDFATSIAYNYGRSGQVAKSDKWSEVAYQRKPGVVTAYNLGLAKKRAGDIPGFERLMNESLKRNKDFAPALSVLGHHYLRLGNAAGAQMLTQLVDSLETLAANSEFDDRDYSMLQRAANALGRSVPDRIGPREGAKGSSSTPFDSENLVVAKSHAPKLEKEV